MVDADKTSEFVVTKESIAADNEYFQSMLALIPAYVLSPDQQSDENDDGPTDRRQNKNKKAKKQKNKMKEEKKGKKHKFETGSKHENDHTAITNTAGYAALSHHTTDTTEVEGKLSKKQKQKQKKKDKKKNKRANPFQEDSTDGAMNGSFTEVKVKKHKPDSEAGNQSASPLPVPALVPSSSDSMLSASIASLDEKRAKLRAKIAEFQANRKLTDRETLERKRLKRQESKMHLKQRRKQQKLMNSNPNVASMKSPKREETPSKPVYNKEGQIVFSKFDFTDSAKKDKKNKKSDLSGKDYKRLLSKIEKRNEKIQKVKEKDAGRAKCLEDKFKWESVMHKAEGEKVKDNPEMLKRALKKKEKMREQRKKKWEDRQNTVQKLQADKQKKRTDNIQKRKQAVKDKKIQKLKKKGRLLPGF